MDPDPNFQLWQWISSNSASAKAVLAGSATPSLTLKEIISLSSDPKATAQAFNFSDTLLGSISAQGSESLRVAIANIYDQTKSQITKDNVIVTNATTGANHIIYRSLLKPSDHVIVQYPTYGPLIEEPIDIGCNVSFWRHRLESNWGLELEELKRLIKPGVTKMLNLNNPNNPTGTCLPTEFQREIIKIAKQHDITIHCDEIFRPLFHNADTAPLTSTTNNNTNGTTTPSNTTLTTIPTSFIEHASTLSYPKILVSTSLSKCYGLSGIRIGWILTPSPTLHASLMHYRLYSMESTSILDETIATEVLSPRCRPAILKKHLDYARTNINNIQSFIDAHSDQAEWVRPTAGACAFVKFKHAKTGEAVDDVEFCKRLVAEKGVLVSPAGLCFSFDEDIGKDGGKGDKEEWKREFKGRVRFHFTERPEVVTRGLGLLGEFLEEEKLRLGVERL